MTDFVTEESANYQKFKANMRKSLEAMANGNNPIQESEIAVETFERPEEITRLLEKAESDEIPLDPPKPFAPGKIDQIINCLYLQGLLLKIAKVGSFTEEEPCHLFFLPEKENNAETIKAALSESAKHHGIPLSIPVIQATPEGSIITIPPQVYGHENFGLVLSDLEKTLPKITIAKGTLDAWLNRTKRNGSKDQDPSIGRG